MKSHLTSCQSYQDLKKEEAIEKESKKQKNLKSESKKEAPVVLQSRFTVSETAFDSKQSDHG